MSRQGARFLAASIEDGGQPVTASGLVDQIPLEERNRHFLEELIAAGDRRTTANGPASAVERPSVVPPPTGRRS